MIRVELRWLPAFHAYAVRIGCRVIGLIQCAERLPFLPSVSIRYA